MKKDKGRFFVKRLIGMMMAVCMLLALIPAVAFADEPGSNTSTDQKEITVTISKGADKIEKVLVDGNSVVGGKVQVEKDATTHKIKIQCQFGYQFSNIKINDIEKDLEGVTDIAEYDVDAADTYNIEIEVGADDPTLVWDYSSDGTLGEDALVQHGKVEIVSTGDEIKNVTEDPSKGGHFSIKAGTQVTVKLIPDYGYQLLSTALNGDEHNVTNVTAAADVSTFTFTMPNTPLHLKALFTPVEDKVTTSSAKVSGGTLTNGEGVINSGNLELSVKDMTPTEEQKSEIEAEAGKGGQVHLYLEMEMNQVVNKGSESDAWKTEMTELNKKVTVTLKVTDTDLKEKAAQGQVYVIREHEGSLEKIPAVYDAANETISFETDQFSTYALASGNATNYLFIGGRQVTYQKGMVSYWRYDEATSSTTACLEGDANIILDDTTDDSDKTYDLLEITLKNVNIQSKDDPSVTGYYFEGCGLWYRNVLYLNVYGDCTISGSAVGLRTDGTTRIYGRDENAKLTIIGDDTLSDQGCSSNFKYAYAVQGYNRVHVYNQVDGTTFSLITKSRTKNTMVNEDGEVLGCTLNGDETKIITSLNFDGSNPEEHPWDGSSFNIGNKEDYQYIEYQMKNAPVIPDEVIDTINITDVTLSFKAGESPKFTGKVVDSDKNKYSISGEGWCLYDADNQLLEEAWSYGAEDDNTLKNFVGGKKYYYNIAVSAKAGYKFSDQVRLFINGEEINWKRNDNSWSNIWYLSAEHIFELTPTSSGDPAEPTEPQNPVNPDQPSNPSQGGDIDKQASADVDNTPDKAKAGTNTAVKTGDENNFLILLLMLAVSGAGIAGVSVYNRRKSR